MKQDVSAQQHGDNAIAPVTSEVPVEHQEGDKEVCSTCS